MTSIEMIALRKFKRIDGQAIVTHNAGDKFTTDIERVPSLEETGKAQCVEQTKPVKKGAK